jgi:hypothetical protein
MRRRPRRTSKLTVFYGLVVIGLMVGGSVWMDRNGSRATARVQAKQERIVVSHEPSGVWDRHWDLVAEFGTPGGPPVSASIELPQARWQSLHVGDSIEVRYFPDFPYLARAAERPTASIAWEFLGKIAAIPFLVWALAGLVGLWIASRLGKYVAIAAGAAWVAAAFPLLFSTRTPPVPSGIEATARVRQITAVTRSPANIRSRRRSIGDPKTRMRLAIPYQVVELIVPSGRDTVIAVDAVDSGSVANLAVGVMLPVRFDPAAPREARLLVGTRRFVDRNRYHFLPGVIGIGIIGTLAALGFGRRRRPSPAPRPDGGTMNRLVATLLLLAVASSAEAQYPRPRTPGGTTSAVGQLPIYDTVIAPAKPGAMRQLVCRGAPDTKISTQQDPSPRSQAQVAMSLSYRRNPRPAGSAYEQLEPGACSWNPTGDASIPAEPGVLHFDLYRVGGAESPDPGTFPVWLTDPRHYWLFYVDDATNISISHGAYGGRFYVADAPGDKKPTATAASLRRERLRCRGGNGLAFERGGNRGNNLFAMTLTYAVAGSAAGPVGGGLQPGTCAWADRTDAKQEPGRVKFTTAGNAQLKQAQSGSAVDRTPTAAERWPDVHTIPAYMTDPTHYWTFTVSLADADNALRHNAWLPSSPAVPPPTGPVATTPSSPSGGGGPVGAKPPGRSGTGVSLPGGSTTGDRYTPGAGPASTDVINVFDIKNVQVRSGLEGVAILFEAAPNLAPVVTVNTTAPVGAEGSYRFNGLATRLAVQGTATGGPLWRYSAASTGALARGTRHWFIAEAPEGPQSQYNQVTGEFRTLAQRVTVTISEFRIISDGDTESDGDLWFTVRSCPNVLNEDIVGTHRDKVQWSEGRHAVNREITAGDASAPDKIRLFIVGIDDDSDITSSGGARDPFQTFYNCEVGGNIGPYKTDRADWNAAVLDLDLSTYQGANATEQFVKRSQPLRNGATVMFEVRGFVNVRRE